MTEYGWYRTKTLAKAKATRLKKKGYYKKVEIKPAKGGYKVYGYWK